jgi:hypothetical protein
VAWFVQIAVQMANRDASWYLLDETGTVTLRGWSAMRRCSRFRVSGCEEWPEIPGAFHVLFHRPNTKPLKDRANPKTG